MLAYNMIKTTLTLALFCSLPSCKPSSEGASQAETLSSKGEITINRFYGEVGFNKEPCVFSIDLDPFTLPAFEVKIVKNNADMDQYEVVDNKAFHRTMDQLKSWLQNNVNNPQWLQTQYEQIKRRIPEYTESLAKLKAKPLAKRNTPRVSERIASLEKMIEKIRKCSFEQLESSDFTLYYVESGETLRMGTPICMVSLTKNADNYNNQRCFAIKKEGKISFP
jgi:hypothetical protein